MNRPIVTIDGPAGTGKSTVSRLVAEKLGLPHLDTGAFYRAATLLAMERGVDLDDEQSVVEMISGTVFDQVDGAMEIDGRDVSSEIREERVTKSVSLVAAHPGVRDSLVAHQRRWVELRGGKAVVEGRDIGTVVFPDAAIKVYLDASPRVRAERRAFETSQDVEEVLAEQERRDGLDSGRVASPLKKPEDAVVIDTSDLSIDDVVASIIELVEVSSD